MRVTKKTQSQALEGGKRKIRIIHLASALSVVASRSLQKMRKRRAHHRQVAILIYTPVVEFTEHKDNS